MEDNKIETPTQPLIGQEKSDDKFAVWHSRIESCKSYRRKLIPIWTQSIDYRRGKPFASQTDEDRISVNLDWPLTKSKQASLFSQIPQVHVNHPPQSLESPWLYSFEQRLNDTLIVAGIEAAMDETLPDCINASGVGAVIVAHESLTEDVEVPIMDMTLSGGMMPDGSPVPTKIVPRVNDHRYTANRISPADLLWPQNFTSSDFDKGPWIGRSGQISWAQGVQVFKLKEEDKDKILGGENRSTLDKLTHDIDKDKTSDEMVEFDEIFYWDASFNPTPKSYAAINHLVFINGKDEPVIDGPWEGQRFENGKLIGSLKFPIRVLTLTYITDESIPPSDSAIGRPQVNELNKSRTQMILQRDRSLPLRWVDINRVDPTILQSLLRGTWQSIIPMQGSGDHAIGEVARAAMPNDDFTFDQIFKNDINEDWGVGPNQSGNFGQGRQSASESNIVETNFQTRIGRERAKVAKFFVSIAEVIGGLLSLFEPPESFGQGFDPAISRTLSYSILADSTVLIDSNQRLKRLMDFINFSASSGFVNVEQVLKEIATLSGLDPNAVIRKPEPKPPVEPTISIRLTGTEDLTSPIAFAMLMKSGQAPDAKLIEDAKGIIQSAVMPPQPPQPPGPPMGPGGMPPPMGPDGSIGPPQGPPIPPEPAPPIPGDANKDWHEVPKINKRQDDI